MVFKGKPKFDQSPPDDFDIQKPFADPVALLEYREYLVREKWVAIETAKEWRERVKACYHKEGVNHHKNCKEVVAKYLDSIRNVGWGKDTRLHGLYKAEE